MADGHRQHDKPVVLDGGNDADIAIERQPDPEGDRVRIDMTGKFLPFKYCGASGNAQEYGYKEE